MKKILIVISMFLLTMIMCASYVTKGGQDIISNDEEFFVETINDKMIRFHVLANSNSIKDQNLKMEVKNKIIEYITPKFNNINSIEQARDILMENNNDIIKIAENCIKEQGFSYKVSTTLGRENFPVKVYGNITLPQGEYEAYRILIGEAKGENWWCVMFPPLCFVDVTKGEVSYEETEEKIKGVLTDEEFEVVNNKNNNNSKLKDKKEESKVKLKFKIFDLFKNKN
ncbi:stage II sporulation protein R [Clostridium tarantellae]|uniref:Stage II sporulation protein R n=1 Tax=Clostridium tarantellae TaxID=39493 RepID=A0A6I1MJX4_9CLOT|nr:stage II sporulation protein R [Clostridium tarantellae]MPQ43013.1 stage II sporulation protein R [Clostridium tarantellae]